MIVIVDNYDSFVYNIAEYVSFFDRVKVVSKSDAKVVPRLNADGIVISPGPGFPDTSLAFIFDYCAENGVPLLGVCLGHQMMAEVYGGEVGKVKPMHGKMSLVKHDGRGVFRGVKNPVRVCRYHSLAVLKVPRGFEVTARSEDDVVMGMRSRDGLLEGVQFHPESVMTEEGVRMIRNFVMKCVGQEVLR